MSSFLRASRSAPMRLLPRTLQSSLLNRALTVPFNLKLRASFASASVAKRGRADPKKTDAEEQQLLSLLAALTSPEGSKQLLAAVETGDAEESDAAGAADKSEDAEDAAVLMSESDDKSDEDVEDEESEDVDEDEIEIEKPKDLTPKEMVESLSTHIVGQHDAKKAVAQAMRQRWRRQQLAKEIRQEVMPKNILMIGPTGVGKTEVARRLAKLTNAPFIKVEATKYTEMGFHGKDVDSIIRDLVEVSITLTRAQHKEKNRRKIERKVETVILDALCGQGQDKRSRATFRAHLRSGLLENQLITIEVPQPAQEGSVAGQNPANQFMVTINKNLAGLVAGKKAERKKMKVSESRLVIEEAEMEKLINSDDVTKEALSSAAEGIVFIDEIDKIVSVSGIHSADASAEGVQRDLLPLIEGSSVDTKHGKVDTDHILFVASGAFTAVKPSDMLAELQGRLPIRVELKALTEEDLYSILTVPKYNLLMQQEALMATEGITVEFTEDGKKEMAKTAHAANQTVQNIGARRLHTVVERLMTDIGYDLPGDGADEASANITIDSEFVKEKVSEILKTPNLSKFVL